jgi:hypothetical protein
MAQLKGSIQFTGSIGNVRSYYNKKLKRNILATKGGASRDEILKNPAFARTRENMNEFKACSMWASLLRKSLFGISHLYGGFRSVESSKIPTLLTTLVFNRSHSFDSALSDKPSVSLSDDRQTVTLTLNGFSPYSRLHWPSRYASYRFALVIARLSDMAWSKEELTYRPVYRDLEQLSVTTYTEWFSWNTDTQDIILNATFAAPTLLQEGVTVVVAMGIEVSTVQLKPTDSYTSSLGTMKILECFS